MVGIRFLRFAQRVCDIASSYEPGPARELPGHAPEQWPWSPAITSDDFLVINQILEVAEKLPVTPESEMPEPKHFFSVKKKREMLAEREGYRQKAQWFDSCIVHPTRRSALQAMDLSRQPPSAEPRF